MVCIYGKFFLHLGDLGSDVGSFNIETYGGDTRIPSLKGAKIFPYYVMHLTTSGLPRREQHGTAVTKFDTIEK